MNQNQQTELLKLQRQEIKWYCAARRARIWIKDDLGQPKRPYAIFVVEGGTEALRNYSVIENAPQAVDFETALIEAMQLSEKSSKIRRFKRYRPAQIVMEDQILVQALAPGFAGAGVDVLLSPSDLQVMDKIGMAYSVYKHEDNKPALLEIPGVSMPMATEFFAAAHDFYKAKPWKNVDNLTYITARYPANNPAAKEYCIIIMGSGGMEFGLARYDSVNVFKQALRDGRIGESRRTTTQIGITFDVPMLMPYGDHDAVEKYGWPIAGSKAYPTILKAHPRKGIIPPDAADVAFFTAALRAVPDFVSSYINPRAGLPKPASVTVELPDAHEGKRITLRYTGEDLHTFGLFGDEEGIEEIEEAKKVVKSIDDQDEVAAVMKLLELFVPIPCKPTPALIERLRGEPGASIPHGAMRIGRVFNAGNEGGITVGLLPLGEDGTMQVASLTMLKIPPTHPVYSAVHAYQKRRRAALGDQP